MRIFYATETDTHEVPIKTGSLLVVFDETEQSLQENLINGLLSISDNEHMTKHLEEIKNYVCITPDHLSS